MKKKQPYLEFIKKINEVDYVASLIIGMSKSITQNFIFLKGDIGSGKTTLVKEIAKHLGEKQEIVSPTFNKMFVYDKLIHIDAYNLEGKTLDSYEDFFEDKIVVIEWAEKLNQKFDYGFQVEIIFIDNETRKYIITWKE